MKLHIIAENVSFKPIGLRDGDEVVAIIGNDDFPVELYYWLNGLGHANEDSFGIPKLLGWVSYRLKDDSLIIYELQSDVMSLTSYWRHAKPEGQKIIKAYKSRLENRHKRWIDETLQYVDKLALKESAHTIHLNLMGLEEGVRFNKIESAALRNGYTKSATSFTKILR